MRIDGPNGLEMQGSSDSGGRPPRPIRPDGLNKATSPREPLVADAASRPYICKALACGEVDAKAVESARELLESGELDTPGAAGRAADQILSQGV